METKKCPHCGVENPINAVNCSSCKKPIKKLSVKFYVLFFIISIVAWGLIRILLIQFNIIGGIIPTFLSYLIAFAVGYFVALKFFPPT